jgi:hypothetical protein
MRKNISDSLSGSGFAQRSSPNKEADISVFLSRKEERFICDFFCKKNVCPSCTGYMMTYEMMNRLNSLSATHGHCLMDRNGKKQVGASYHQPKTNCASKVGGPQAGPVNLRRPRTGSPSSVCESTTGEGNF